MPKSLDKLVKTLSSNEFKYTSEAFPNPDELKLVQKKGVHPYDYIDSFEKFNETSLPSKESFFNKLNDEDISTKQYQHAQNVWNTFKCTTIRMYHDIYLKSDILLLADVFEKFRTTCISNYGLDPAHYYTTPGLA